MTAHVIPVGVSNKHGCERRQSWRKGLQCFVCTLCKVWSGARVNANELMPVLGNNEVVFREFEAGQRIDATGYDLGDTPGRKSVTGGFVLRKRCGQSDRVIEIGIPTTPQVLLGLCRIAIIDCEL